MNFLPPEDFERRHFLFLQGPSSSLFAKIGKRLAEAGHRVMRVNLCPGDWLFWHGPLSRNYRGRLENWQSFLEALLDREGVTDLVLLGEERPHHSPARALCMSRGIPVHVIEMGYLRPDWVTLERGGMSTNSHFPDDPGLIRAAAQGLPAPDFVQRYTQRFVVEAGLDAAFNLGNVFFWFFFPFYRPHAIDHPLAEYGGWLRKLLFHRGRSRASRRAAEAICEARQPFFLFPLQLETDYQIRVHSPFDGQQQAIEQVFKAFADGAPHDCTMVVKVHPLDNGLRDWSRICREAKERGAMRQPLLVLQDGDISDLIVHARGTVTVNSTAGVQALRAARPVKVLGSALYDIEGLTDQRDIRAFFADPAAPEPALLDAFLRLLAAAIHVRGNFYSRAGTDAAARAIADRLIARNVNEPGAFVDLPPRRAAR